MERLIHVPPQYPKGSSTHSTLAFIGEAPSHEELSAGVPFVGTDGRIFNSMLRLADIEREAVFITNAFDEKCPDNDCADFMRDEGKVRENIARLEVEIAAVNPNVLVPLGGTALWMLTGSPAIEQVRGSVTKAKRIAPGMKLLPTFHPGRIRKQWKLLALGVGDFIKAKREAALGPGFFYPKVRLWVEPTRDEAIAFMEDCKSADLLSTDIETGWGQITSVGFAPSPDLAMCIPFVDLRRTNKSYWQNPDDEFAVVQKMRELLAHPVPKLGQNFGAYDVLWLYRKLGARISNYRHDTRLQHHALFPELPKDLASMAGSYTKVGAWKGWGGRFQKEKRDA